MSRIVVSLGMGLALALLAPAPSGTAAGGDASTTPALGVGLQTL